MKTRKVNHLRLVEKAQYYRFTDNVDPDLAFICNHILDNGLSPSEIVDIVEEVSNGRVRIHYMTIFNWLEGKTKRPHNHTLTWVGRALGLERTWRAKKGGKI